MLLINPIDPTIKCLRRTTRNIARRTGAGVVWVFPNDYSRKACRSKIANCSKNELIVFLGHGRSDALFGSKGKWYAHLGQVSAAAIAAAPDRYYLDDNLIDESCLYLFRDKKCVLFSCNSDEFGVKMVQAGCRAVLGFRRLPSSIDELKDDWYLNMADRQMAAAISGILNVAFRNALVNGVRNGHTFAELEGDLRFEINSQVGRLMKTRACFKAAISDVLIEMARDIQAIGDRGCRLI